MKLAPDTSCAALYTAVEEFVRAECDKAGQDLSGQMSHSAFGMSMGLGVFSVKWQATAETISFEGDVLPRDLTPVSQFIVDGDPFQATGKLTQTVGCSTQTTVGAAPEKKDTKYVVADAMFSELDTDGSGALNAE